MLNDSSCVHISHYGQNGQSSLIANSGNVASTFPVTSASCHDCFSFCFRPVDEQHVGLLRKPVFQIIEVFTVLDFDGQLSAYSAPLTALPCGSAYNLFAKSATLLEF